MRYFSILLLSTIIFVMGCDSSTESSVEGKKVDHDHGHHHHAKGEHGGEILDSGGTLHVEFVHNKQEGKVSLYIFGGDAKTPQNLVTAPLVNLKTTDGPKQLATKKVGDNASHYEVADGLLKKELDGRIAIDFEGKRYNLDLASHDHDDHEHDHDDDEHDNDHQHK